MLCSYCRLNTLRNIIWWKVRGTPHYNRALDLRSVRPVCPDTMPEDSAKSTQSASAPKTVILPHPRWPSAFCGTYTSDVGDSITLDERVIVHDRLYETMMLASTIFYLRGGAHVCLYRNEELTTWDAYKQKQRNLFG